MPHTRVEVPFDGDELLQDLHAYLDRCQAKAKSSEPIKPPNRIKFHWPPHAISHDYHVMKADWTEHTTFSIDGEVYPVSLATTQFGVFARLESMWVEVRGESVSDACAQLPFAARPLLARQRSIAEALEMEGRYTEEIKELSPLNLLKLFYCEDRDVAHVAHEWVERTHFRNAYLPSLCAILRDESHRWRRSAQWCVLDLFEDLPSYTSDEAEEAYAVDSIKQLLLTANDDFARTVFKAGVVLGGHLAHRKGGQVLLECLESGTEVGKRSAIHGLFHVCEWVPEMIPVVSKSLIQFAKREENLLLSGFAFGIADDIERKTSDHVPEPLFPFEA